LEKNIKLYFISKLLEEEKQVLFQSGFFSGAAHLIAQYTIRALSIFTFCNQKVTKSFYGPQLPNLNGLLITLEFPLPWNAQFLLAYFLPQKARVTRRHACLSCLDQAIMGLLAI